MVKGIGEQEVISHIHNLQFADNTLIFSGVLWENITSLKFILYSFELLSCLRINFEKSTVIGIGITKKT